MKSHILYSLSGWISPFVTHSALVIASATHLVLMSVKNTILAFYDQDLGLASVKLSGNSRAPTNVYKHPQSWTSPLRVAVP